MMVGRPCGECSRGLAWCNYFEGVRGSTFVLVLPGRTELSTSPLLGVATWPSPVEQFKYAALAFAKRRQGPDHRL
jgi:hypothetical protein